MRDPSGWSAVSVPASCPPLTDYLLAACALKPIASPATDDPQPAFEVRTDRQAS